ncbi:MAG: hypothetical protein HGB06_06690 [Chlorobaculum sp.]|nr:hypothetical protein [Chlorobaculum sp.]
MQGLKNFDGVSHAGVIRREERLIRDDQGVWDKSGFTVSSCRFRCALKLGRLIARFRFAVERRGLYHQPVTKHRDREKERYLENAENISADAKFSRMHKPVAYASYYIREENVLFQPVS